MVTAIKETGSMVKLMVEDSILTQMGHFITENGKKTYRMVKALRNGQMVPSMRVSMQKVKNVAKENLLCLTVRSMRDLFRMISYLE